MMLFSSKMHHTGCNL